jgi:hypothetical protein
MKYNVTPNPLNLYAKPSMRQELTIITDVLWVIDACRWKCRAAAITVIVQTPAMIHAARMARFAMPPDNASCRRTQTVPKIQNAKPPICPGHTVTPPCINVWNALIITKHINARESGFAKITNVTNASKTMTAPKVWFVTHIGVFNATALNRHHVTAMLSFIVPAALL